MNTNTEQELIRLLAGRLQDRQPTGWNRLEQALRELNADFSNRRFFRLFALCPRWFEQASHDLAEDDAAEWQHHDPHGVLRDWQYPQLARLLVLLQPAAGQDRERYVASINELYKTADVNELILLGQSLTFLPGSERFLERARESARSNIVPVFSAIAHRSNYARRLFDQVAWNQLVLKAAFLAAPIWSIPGLQQRNNPELVTMLRHYATERQAAHRSVPWDLWCCIGWLAQPEPELDYLRQQWHTAVPIKTRAAITLSLAENPLPAAQTAAGMLSLPDHRTEKLSWALIASWPD
jgi:hypothetical protein